ncbi:hypothetical protein [Mesorhizobium sp. Pch-S]|uniref:ribosome modulation factor n=1 Tax=Mesorhizobium sp. Pch-S TaxID=2082387 RepID=UPI0010110DE6|nr:hypothetical protein [Mesorhizobium sp. Pch-S]QAZ45929.1 hypothetical protein C1M53_26450 [Mesorhizobium sp. Pch-S]
MAKKPAKADLGHNSEREQWEEQQFLNGFRQIKEHEADMAGTKGEMAGVYKRLEKLGFTKADFKWAKELEDEDAPKIIETMRRRLRIARFFGHGVSRQIELFESDRTPADERAYGEGLAAGKLRKDNANPYGADSKQGQAWQRGFNEGTEFINKELAGKFDEDGGSELISGADPFEPEPVTEAAE